MDSIYFTGYKHRISVLAFFLFNIAEPEAMAASSNLTRWLPHRDDCVVSSGSIMFDKVAIYGCIAKNGSL